jgi:hypothetical protein
MTLLGKLPASIMQKTLTFKNHQRKNQDWTPSEWTLTLNLQ